MIECVPRGTRVVAMRFTPAMYQAIVRGLKRETRRPLTAGNCNLSRGDFEALDLTCGRADVGSWPVAGLKCRLDSAGGRRSVTIQPRIQPGAMLWPRQGQSGPGARRENAQIMLRVCEVRATRLMEITEAEALAEGVEIFAPPGWWWDDNRNVETRAERLTQAYDFQLAQLGKKRAAQWRATDVACEVRARDGRATARHCFALLFESINGPGSWVRNPWVWRYAFKSVSPPLIQVGEPAS